MHRCLLERDDTIRGAHQRHFESQWKGWLPTRIQCTRTGAETAQAGLVLAFRNSFSQTILFFPFDKNNKTTDGVFYTNNTMGITYSIFNSELSCNNPGSSFANPANNKFAVANVALSILKERCTASTSKSVAKLLLR